MYVPIPAQDVRDRKGGKKERRKKIKSMSAD